MPRARIGKLFHLTPARRQPPRRRVLLQHAVLAAVHDAQLLVALAPPRGDLHHRRDVDRADALPARRARATRRRAGTATPSASGPGCTTWRSTSTTSTTSPSGSQAAGVRITDAGSGTTVFCHPKDTPGMLEFHPATRRPVGAGRPPLPARVELVPPTRTGRSTRSAALRMSHITVVTGDLDAAEQLYVDVLDAQPLPEQAATVAGRDLAALPRRRGHRGRDDGPQRHRHRRRPRPRRGSDRRSPA